MEYRALVSRHMRSFFSEYNPELVDDTISRNFTERLLCNSPHKVPWPTSSFTRSCHCFQNSKIYFTELLQCVHVTLYMFPSELLKFQIFVCVLCLCLPCLNIWNPSYGFSKSSEDSGGRISSVRGVQRSQLNYLPFHKMKLENQKLYNRAPGEAGTQR